MCVTMAIRLSEHTGSFILNLFRSKENQLCYIMFEYEHLKTYNKCKIRGTFLIISLKVDLTDYKLIHNLEFLFIDIVVLPKFLKTK